MPLSFATPLDSFSHVVLTHSSAVLRLKSENTIVDMHGVLHIKMKNLLVEHAYSNLKHIL